MNKNEEWIVRDHWTMFDALRDIVRKCEWQDSPDFEAVMEIALKALAATEAMKTIDMQDRRDAAPKKPLPDLTHLRVPSSDCDSCRRSGEWIDGFQTGTCEDCGIGVCRECGNPDDDVDGVTFWCAECYAKVVAE